MMTFLRNKFEKEYRNGTGWEKAFQEDKKEMMNIPDDVFYVTGRLDKDAENTAVSININSEKRYWKTNYTIKRGHYYYPTTLRR